MYRNRALLSLSLLLMLVVASACSMNRQLPEAAPSVAAEPASAARPAGKRQPVLIRALELLNAPFNFVNDAARELMGKVAILTLVNALLILVYVVFIRKT